VLEYIQEFGFSSVPVVKDVDGDEVYRGLVSRNDLIEQPDEDQLALLMREVPTVDADDAIGDAAATMVAEDSRRLPVVDGDRLVGILTVTDVVRAIARGEIDGDTEVGGLATRAVNATYTETRCRSPSAIGLANVPPTPWYSTMTPDSPASSPRSTYWRSVARVVGARPARATPSPNRTLSGRGGESRRPVPATSRPATWSCPWGRSTTS